MTEPTEMTFAARLAPHPLLKARFEAILEVVENAQGDLSRADEAEQRVAISANELKKKETNVVGHGQKNSFGTRPVVTLKCGNAYSSEWVSHFVRLALQPGFIIEDVHCRYNELALIWVRSMPLVVPVPNCENIRG